MRQNGGVPQHATANAAPIARVHHQGMADGLLKRQVRVEQRHIGHPIGVGGVAHWDPGV